MSGAINFVSLKLSVWLEWLTPQSHEDGEEDRGRVVKQVTGPRCSTGAAQFPVAAHSVTQRTHGNVVLRVTDLHASKDISYDYNQTKPEKQIHIRLKH